MNCSDRMANLEQVNSGTLYHARHRIGLFNDFATENTKNTEEWEKMPSK